MKVMEVEKGEKKMEFEGRDERKEGRKNGKGRNEEMEKKSRKQEGM